MNIENRVIKVIAEVLRVPLVEVTIDSTKDSLCMDSLDDIECLMALEEDFDIEISDFEGEQLNSVRDVVVMWRI